MENASWILVPIISSVCSVLGIGALFKWNVAQSKGLKTLFTLAMYLLLAGAGLFFALLTVDLSVSLMGESG